MNATSSLALSVAGVLKEFITIGGGIFFFSERLDLLNVVGLILCQVGILSYVKLRYDSNDERENQQTAANEPYMTMDSSFSQSPGNEFGEVEQITQNQSSLHESTDMDLS